jgi:diaminohydroxyphosphoribosylaminopyrimidine deaminase/5-amino-6-(5-phosphoribosylamino)uracil reductase
MSFDVATLRLALERARFFAGATSPNPPVGAVALDASGEVLALGAHERAGAAHAEAGVIAELRARGLLKRVETLFISLEPCNHHGRTPPCTEAILASGIGAHEQGRARGQVIYGARDPNPHVAGSGAERLRQAGVKIRALGEAFAENASSSVATSPADERELAADCARLIAPFAHWARTGMPWVTIKTAHLRRPRDWSVQALRETMLPPTGQKTFTSPESLRLAHELRRRADAILTGVGTVLADRPELTVRHVPDHEIVRQGLKRRRVVVLDRHGRTPSQWIKDAENRGLEVWIRPDLEAVLAELGRAGVLEALVEAGPELSSFMLQPPSAGRIPFWNEHVLIIRGTQSAGQGTDEVICSLASSKT